MVRLARLWLPLRKSEEVKPFLANPSHYSALIDV